MTVYELAKQKGKQIGLLTAEVLKNGFLGLSLGSGLAWRRVVVCNLLRSHVFCSATIDPEFLSTFLYVLSLMVSFILFCR